MKPFFPSGLKTPGTRRLRAVRRHAFTLIEVCVAMALGLLVIGVAALSIAGVQAEGRLKKAAARIELTTRRSLMEAVNRRQTVRVDLAGAFGKEGGLQVRRAGEKLFRQPARGETWEFLPGGLCEPVEIRVQTEAGEVEMSFDPLTGCAVRKEVRVRS